MLQIPSSLVKARQSSTETKQSVYVQMLEKQELLLIQYDYDYWGRNQNNFEKLRIMPEEEHQVEFERKEENEEDDEECRIWGLLLRIPYDQYVRLAFHHRPICALQKNGNIEPVRAVVTWRTRRSYNRIILVEYNDEQMTSVVVCVPSVE